MAERSRVSRATAKHAQRRRWTPTPEQRERERLREQARQAAAEEARALWEARHRERGAAPKPNP